MAIVLRHWQPATGGFDLVYVNGLEGVPPGTKVHLRRTRGRVTVSIQGDAGALDADTVLAEVTQVVPGGDTSWEAIVAFARDQPAARRGTKPGTRASSRADCAATGARGGMKAIPTQADFDTVETDMRSHPIPEPTTLLVDHREPGEMVDLLRTVRNLLVEVTTLEVGDYAVPGHLVLERKTVSDFVNSVTEEEGRLFHQTEAMARSGMLPVVLLEGDVYAQGRMPIKNVDGTLSYLVAIRRIPTFHTRSLPHTAEVIAKLVRHAVHGLGYPDPATKAAAPQAPRAAAAYMLSCIPGVSSTLAARLLSHFGSVRAVAEADAADLRAVDGVGPVIAASIAATMGRG